MKFSVKLKINTQRVAADLNAALFFQVLINSQKTTIPLELNWNINFFDYQKELILPKSKLDKDFNDYKLIIETKRNEINEIFKFYRLSGKLLDIETFKKEIQNTKSRVDFLVYWRTEIHNRFVNQTISEQTRKNNNSALSMLQRFKDSLLFKDLSKKTIEDYQSFLKRAKTPTGKNYRINTIAKYLTDFKTYLEFARADGIIFDDPFVEIKITTNKGSITYLNHTELNKIYQYFQENDIKEAHKIILRPFLFACFTGLRHSDLERVTWREIKSGNELEFEPYKTRDLQKIVKIPLCQNAVALVQTRKGNLFQVYANQKTNERLKEVANICGIFKNLTTHVARHTFATQFLENGGQLQVLKELMGHSKIETTMIYVHVTNEHKRKQIQLLDNIILQNATKKPLEINPKAVFCIPNPYQNLRKYRINCSI